MSTPALTATHSVTVSSLSATTSQATLEHFFSFCGKIESITHEGTVAKVAFVKESAAKTALMLNGGTLDGSTIMVTSEDTKAPTLAGIKATDASAVQTPSEKENSDVEQEDKPKAAVMSEYLAHGYLLSDAAIEKAIAADQQYGISSRFLNFFNPLATKAKATAQPHVDAAAKKLQEVDEKQGLSLKASAAGIVGSRYYNAALSSPFGSKVHAFYTSTQKQVLDVHEEAMRIKESQKAATASSSGAGGTHPVASDAPVVGTGTVSAVDATLSQASKEKPLETTTA